MCYVMYNSIREELCHSICSSVYTLIFYGGEAKIKKGYLFHVQGEVRFLHEIVLLGHRHSGYIKI